MALAHNGNLSNAVELRNELELFGAIFHTTSDTETIAYIITKRKSMFAYPHHRFCIRVTTERILIPKNI